MRRRETDELPLGTFDALNPPAVTEVRVHGHIHKTNGLEFKDDKYVVSVLVEDGDGGMTDALITSELVERRVGMPAAELERLVSTDKNEARRRLGPFTTFLRTFEGAMRVRACLGRDSEPVVVEMAPLVPAMTTEAARALRDELEARKRSRV